MSELVVMVSLLAATVSMGVIVTLAQEAMCKQLPKRLSPSGEEAERLQAELDHMLGRK